MKSNDHVARALNDLRYEHRRIQPPPGIRALVQGRPFAKTRSHSPHRLLMLTFAACSLFFLGLFTATILRFHSQPLRNDSIAQMGASKESTTAFIPLPSSAGLPPPQETSLLRVRLQESELRQFGLEVPEPSSTRYTQVEFAVGEDGLARALRFVQSTSTGSRP